MSEVEIITDGGRHRRWSSEYKVRIVEETLLAGETISSIARYHYVVRNLVYRWRRFFELYDRKINKYT